MNDLETNRPRRGIDARRLILSFVLWGALMLSGLFVHQPGDGFIVFWIMTSAGGFVAGWGTREAIPRDWT
jgi:hypothetical protein